MGLNPRLRKLYSTAHAGNIQEVQKLIISSELSKEERCDWFSRATIDRQKVVAELILLNGCSPKNQQQTQEGTAANKAKDEVIVALTQKVAKADRFPASLFMALAVNEGNEKLVSALLSKGANVHSKVTGSFTAIQSAVRRGYSKIVETLLAAGADVNSTHKGWTLLHSASFEGNGEIVALLLEYGAKVDAKSPDGSTALYTTVEKGFTGIAEWLLCYGANINACDSEKRTLLHLASDCNLAETAELLLKNGADLESRCPNRWTPLMVATNSESAEVVEILLKFGASTSPESHDKKTAFEIAWKKNNEKVAIMLLKRTIASYTEEYLSDLLSSATYRGWITIVEYLLDYGVGVNLDSGRGSLLHIASQSGYPKIVKLLLDYGADIEAKDNHGFTALNLAVMEACMSKMYGQKSSSSNHLAIVTILLRSNANIYARNDFGTTPINLAAFRQPEPAALKILLEYGSANMRIVSETDALDLFDDVNMLRLPARPKWKPVVTTSEVLVKHFVKMEVAGLYVGKETRVAKLFNDQDEIRGFRTECEAEMRKICQQKVGHTDVTFHEILTSDPGKMLHLAKNESVARVLRSCDFCGEFPIYGCILWSQFDKVMIRDFREKGIKVCHFLLNRIRPIPYDVSEILARRYLGRKNLRILTELALNLKLGVDFDFIFNE